MHFDNKSAEPTHEAGLSSLLTDGDYYLPDELALVKNGDAYVANPDAPTYAKSTAYNRASTFWADCKGIWVDMGEVYAVDTVFVASGVHFQPVTMAAAATMTEQERAAAESQYKERTFVRDLQVYISADRDTLFNDENRVFSYAFVECRQKQKERVSVGYACPLYYKTNMVGSLALAVLLEPGEDTSVDKRILRKLQWCAERINGLLDFDDVIGVWISRW